MPAPDTQPGYAWHLIERRGVADADRVDSFSRDADAERLGAALGLDVVQIPLTEEEARQVDALPGRVRTEGGYAEAKSYPTGLQMAGVPAVRRKGLIGEGAIVAVLDTGLDLSYRGLFAAVEGESFVASERWDSDKVSGHGSHVAGTIGSAAHGAAPGADMLIGKVLSDSGSGSYAGIIKGLEWAVQRGAKVINLSLGGPGDKDHPLSLACDAAARSAIVCVAAGNEQRGTTEPQADSSTPASSRDAVTVGAVDSSRRIADFSNLGEALDIAAHGVRVESLGGVLSGTSMAAPHVAGVAALLVGKLPGRAPAQIRRSLFSGAVNTSLGVRQEGYGLLSAPGALERLTASPRTSEKLREIMSRHMREAWREWKLRPKTN